MRLFDVRLAVLTGSLRSQTRRWDFRNQTFISRETFPLSPSPNISQPTLTLKQLSNMRIFKTIKNLISQANWKLKISSVWRAESARKCLKLFSMEMEFSRGESTQRKALTELKHHELITRYNYLELHSLFKWKISCNESFELTSLLFPAPPSSNQSDAKLTRR